MFTFIKIYSSRSKPRSLNVLSSCLSDHITQSSIRLKLFSSSEYNIAKLNFIKAFKKAKKFALISGKELKSVVIRGKLEPKIMPTRVDKKSGLITVFIFERTNVKRETNYCSFVYGIHS